MTTRSCWTRRAAWIGGLVMMAGLHVAPASTGTGAQGEDPERLLAERFGLTPVEIEQARGGQAVVKVLPSGDAGELALLATMRVPGDPERLFAWLENIEHFRTAAELGTTGRLSSPPRLEDFRQLTLEESDIRDLMNCRVGDCELRMNARSIQRFQSEVDWAAPDAWTQATTLAHRLLLENAQAYLRGGHQALGALTGDRTPRLVADEFDAIIRGSTNLYQLAPALATYLERFPGANLDDSTQFLYWSKASLGPQSHIALNQLITWRAPRGERMIAVKQVYASRYVDASMAVISMMKTPDGAGYYVIVGSRSRSSMLRGIKARLLRPAVESSARSTIEMYLGWVRDSLAAR